MHQNARDLCYDIGLLRPRNNESMFLSCLNSKSIVTLRTSDFERVHSFDMDIFVYCFCELEDGSILGGGSELEIWYQGMRRRRLTGHRAPINHVVELMNKTIASVSRDHTVKIWNAQTGECIRTLEGHTHWVSAILELSDGTLVSASNDYFLLVWNQNGECVSKQRMKYGVCSLAELDDGSVVTGGYEGEIEIWKTHNKLSDNHPEGLYPLRADLTIVIPSGLERRSFSTLCQQEVWSTCVVAPSRGKPKSRRHQNDAVAKRAHRLVRDTLWFPENEHGDKEIDALNHQLQSQG